MAWRCISGCLFPTAVPVLAAVSVAVPSTHAPPWTATDVMTWVVDNNTQDMRRRADERAVLVHQLAEAVLSMENPCIIGAMVGCASARSDQQVVRNLYHDEALQRRVVSALWLYVHVTVPVYTSALHLALERVCERHDCTMGDVLVVTVATIHDK
jgi:hypothetical protein